MEWIEVSIETENQGVDVIAQVFYEVGVQGVVVQDPSDISAFMENTAWEQADDSLLDKTGEEVTVKGYFNDAFS